MKKLKTILAVCAAAAASCFVFSACGNTDNSGAGDNNGGTSIVDSDTENKPQEKPQPKPFTVTTDVVNGYETSTVGEETVYTFNVSGEYTLSGDLKGRLVFSEDIGDSSTIKLNNCNITSSMIAVSWTWDSKKINIITVDGTTNTITTTAGEDECSAINSENNVKLGGSGTLTITGNQKHAVSASDLEIEGTIKLNVKAANDGLHAKSVAISGGTTVISDCGDEGIQVEINKKGNKGTVEISDGAVTIKNCKNAVKADTSVTVASPATLAISSCEEAIVCDTVSAATGTTTVDGNAYTAAA